MTERRPILLLIDVEPDDRKTTQADDGWKSSETALEHLDRLRVQLESATGNPARFNWFLRGDPQITQTWGRADWVAEACPRIIKSIERHEDHAGAHVHLWRFDDKRGEWYNDFRDPAWAERCLDEGISAHRSIFGAAPESCRYGDRWLSRAAVELLREKGIRYDLTVEPGMPGGGIHDDRHAVGSRPDFRGAPREPWQPAPWNYLEHSPMPDALWMIPVTTTAPSLRLVRRAPWLMVASRSPNLSLSSSYVWPHLQRELDRPAHSPLVFVFRSGDLAQRRFLRNFETTTALLARHPALAYCDFTTVPEAVQRWRATVAAGAPR